MSVDQLDGRPALAALDVHHPIEAVPACDAASQVAGGQLPRVVIVASASTETVESLLLSIARGNKEAFAALQSRMAGLVRVNVRRVLRDASRCESVTQETFADVLQDAIHFDPQRASAQTWLLTRAHRHAMDRLRSVDGGAVDRQGSGTGQPALSLLP